jgi:MoaA/NifB/PqqE/SkfB family radical SAM enzyme
MVALAEVVRRARGRVTGRLESLPILALSVHSACNCKCVMCDIWKANSEKREISATDLDRHVADIRALNVQRIMLTGGEPLLHSNLWTLCARLQEIGARITLVTTGLLIEPHAVDIARYVDAVVISLDGPAEVHDAIRRIRGGFDRIARGVGTLRTATPKPRLIARSVVQRNNFASLAETVDAAHRLGFDELSFLAADVTTQAFNRPEPWTDDRIAEVAVGARDLPALEASIDTAVERHPDRFREGFVAGGRASLDRIQRYYAALAGRADRPAVACNAPWISAVLEPGGALRPCFFHQPYDAMPDGLASTLNSERAIAFRRALNVEQNPTCQRCVCSLNLPLSRSV